MSDTIKLFEVAAGEDGSERLVTAAATITDSFVVTRTSGPRPRSSLSMLQVSGSGATARDALRALAEEIVALSGNLMAASADASALAYDPPPLSGSFATIDEQERHLDRLLLGGAETAATETAASSEGSPEDVEYGDSYQGYPPVVYGDEAS